MARSDLSALGLPLPLLESSEHLGTRWEPCREHPGLWVRAHPMSLEVAAVCRG